jgi:hypothetical protein
MIKRLDPSKEDLKSDPGMFDQIALLVALVTDGTVIFCGSLSCWKTVRHKLQHSE